MSRDVLVGIDGGTGGVRVGLYGLDGRQLGFASTDYRTRHEQPGWAEQSPADWWSALVASMREVMAKTGVPKERILALATGTTSCSVVLCKRDGTPVRDCLIWMDVRASREVIDIAERTGEKLSAEWMPGKLLWLKRHEREHYDEAEVFCEYQDWLTHRLTGMWSINVNNSVNWGYNAREGRFAEEFYEAIGLADAVAKFPKDRVFAVGDPIGTLTPEAADELGLDPETLVAQGGIDSSIGVLGMGVCGPGHVALITGSSNLAMLLVEEPLFHEATINLGPDNLLKGYYTSYRGQVSSGSIMRWFRREFCRDLEGGAESPFDVLNREAGKLPIGSDGLVVLDYWQGNRHPHLDFNVRGMIYGLSLHHTRAHLYRALMEGIAYGTENLLRQFRENGVPVREVNVAGGTANSDLFMQIHADVSNTAFNVPADHQAVCLGAAICAAKAAGVYPSLQDGTRAMVRIAKRYEPIPGNHERYKAIFEQYRRIYPEFGHWMRETTELYMRSRPGH